MPDSTQPPVPLDPPEETPPAPPARDPQDAAQAHGPLHVEKLEGRQESGRDAQDEAQEDEEIR